MSAVGRGTLISLIATDCSTKRTIGRRQVEVDRKEDVLAAVGRLTEQLRGSLGESGASVASHNVPIDDATTPSLEALKAYTEAAVRRAAGNEMDAIALLERAIAIYPQFAFAYTTLSSVYGGLGETGRSEKFARLAYEHRDRVTERERLFIASQYHDRTTGDQETAAAAEQQGFAQIASGYEAQAALTEALYGARPDALARARTLIRSATAYEPQLRAAVALALAGAPDEAEAVLRRLRGVRREDTLLHHAYRLPAEAAVLLARGSPEAALEALRQAAAYETGMVAALLPAYLRGEARRQAGGDAEWDYRTVLDHRGADPFSPLIPMAQLGLARALARAGNEIESRKIYDALLTTWKRADADLPILRAQRR